MNGYKVGDRVLFGTTEWEILIIHSAGCMVTISELNTSRIETVQIAYINSVVKSYSNRHTIIDPLTGEELDSLTLIPVKNLVDLTNTKILE